jgi:cell division protein FtsI (penicillin-binding protein 3)
MIKIPPIKRRKLQQPKSPETKANYRLFYLAAFLGVWLIAICVRLVWLQLVEYGDLTQKANRQQQRSIEVSPVRGNIFDRNGNELAMTVSVDSIFAVPSEVPDIHSASRLLGRVLDADASEIEDRMHASRAFAWVARKIDNSVSSRVRSLNLKGIYFQKESKRFYPKQGLAAQVLGYVGLDDAGLGGVERVYQPRLSGKPGKMLITMDARRRWFGRVEKNPEPGENVVLTIDEKIQYIAERELQKAINETRAESGTVIVENPKTGEILALANRPTFNPNLLSEADPKSLKNRAVSDIYEPGSTFKIITLAAALEEKLTNPNEVIDCQMGSIVLSGLRIHDHKAYGDLTVAQVLEKSSDVGAIKIALRLGEERFDRYIRAFGFGAQTGVELPGETRGITKPVSRWSKVSIGAISMGQEIGVSPMQLISLISTIGNDGVAVPPRVIAGTTAPRSTPQLISYKAPIGRRVISPMTAAEMKRMLEGVVLRGTGTKAILDGYSSAGKTGTAQKIDATGRYSHKQHIASFAGFAPINSPAISVLVVLDSPQTGIRDGGGDVAAPVFQRIAQQVLGYMNVPHDVELQDQRRLQLRAKAKDEIMAEAAPDHIADQAVPADVPAPAPDDSHPAPAIAATVTRTVPADIRSVPDLTAKASPAPIANPTPGAAARLSPAIIANNHAPAVTPVSAPQRGTLVFDTAGGVLVPDFRGLAVRSALEQAQAAGIDLEISGSGVGREQTPEAGAKLPPGGHVTVKFSR